jgi:hypothetical protein
MSHFPHDRWSKRLRRGDRVWAVVQEIPSTPNYAIVAIHGHLIRVANQSAHPLRLGERIQLSVLGTEPLEFRLLKGNPPSISSRHLDVEI